MAARKKDKSKGSEDKKLEETINYETVEFRTVRASEHRCIDERRKTEGRNPVREIDRAGHDSSEAIYDTVGLALSGGGIRSAAFCMGALQALHVAGLIKYIDYLSTVSGGGYIGTSMSAGMSNVSDGTTEPLPDQFPFKSQLDNQDPPAVRHIRDYSNYLMPNGVADVIGSIVIYLRGLTANTVIVLLWLLIFASVTIYLNPTRDLLGEPIIGSWFNPFGFKNFALTLHLTFAFMLILMAWGIYRSLRLDFNRADTASWVTRSVGYLGVIILVIAFCETQPFVLKGLFAVAEVEASNDVTYHIGQWIIGALASLSVGVSFLSNAIARILKTTTDSDRLSRRFVAAVGKFAVLAAGAILPLLLWASYLQIAFWGIPRSENDPAFMAPPWLLQCREGALSVMNWFQPWFAPHESILAVYVLAIVVLVIISGRLKPNANSLHRLYRDRLSQAFVFGLAPETEDKSLRRIVPTGFQETYQIAAGNPEKVVLRLLDKIKLSELNEKSGPYHIINTALNIQGSKHVNQRARNAEFFMLSKKYCGSEPTGYVETKALENLSPELDLATAMAVSGAAASANMGANTVRPLTPTLTLLNVRLGFWLNNPNSLSLLQRIASKPVNLLNIYFFREMFGLLDEKSRIVYLTDGGHVENLGIYELLKRRCQLIIAVDAEADPEMNFGSLIKLQRHASIDLGVRIELPWRLIRETTLEISKEIAASEGQGAVKPRLGPHCAVGRILYNDDQSGILLYVKSSISGDENDYIIDYKRRNASFPHETTNDQFFSEEQFEVYRALGFHAVNRTLAGEEAVPTHSGSNEGLYAPIMKIWKGGRFKDAGVDKAEEVLRFAAGEGGEVLPSSDKAPQQSPKPPKTRQRTPKKAELAGVDN